MFAVFYLLRTGPVTLKFLRHISKGYMVESSKLIEQGDIILAKLALIYTF
jgi:SAM-dependent methyltransferase